MALAGLGSQWGWWHFGTGFRILRWSAYGGVAAVLVAIAGLVHARPGGRRRGFTLSVIALVSGVIAFGILWQWQRIARGVPPIHDITTDTQNPPEFVAIRPLRADAPNPVEYAGAEVARLQREAYPHIQPRRVEAAPEVAFSRAVQAARSLRWEIVSADTANLLVEATDRTFWFGFEDDVVIRITPAAGGASRVDVRSKSRVGGGDAGTNARRITRFFERLEGR
jgi:uncharacterized protein (DUF1499 family)